MPAGALAAHHAALRARTSGKSIADLHREIHIVGPHIQCDLLNDLEDLAVVAARETELAEIAFGDTATLASKFGGERNRNVSLGVTRSAVAIGRDFPLIQLNLVAPQVGRVRQVVCASPEYLGRRGTPRGPGDLERHDSVTFDALSPNESWVFGEGRRRAVVLMRSRLRLNTAGAALDAAIAGTVDLRCLAFAKP